MSHVRIRARKDAPRVLDVRLVFPGETGFATWHGPDRPIPPGDINAFRERAHKAYAGGAEALRVDGALVIRRAVAERAFAAALGAGDATLREVRLAKELAGNEPKPSPATLEDDWALVDTPRRHPLDRDRLPAMCFTYPDGDASVGPHGALVSYRPDDIAWEPLRASRAAMFRAGEQPIDLFVEKALYSSLTEATGGAIEEGPMRPDLKILETTSTCPRFVRDRGVATAAATAFWCIYAGGASASDRAAALASPIYAFWLASVIDRGPRDDTRRAACKHPYYALLYAREVDRGPRDDTRAAASKSPDSALEYMRDVDHAPHAATRRGMADSRRLPDYETEALRAPRAWAAPAKTFPPEKLASTPKAVKAERAGKTGFCVLGWGKSALADVTLGFPDVPDAFFELELPLGLLPPTTAIRARASSGASLRKRAAKLHGLKSSFPVLVLRKSDVAGVLAGVPQADLLLRPVVLHDDGGVIDDDFVLVDVRAEVPLDRSASDASWSVPSRPGASFARSVERVAWSPQRAPHPRIFRVAELPSCIVADATLAAALVEACGGAVAVEKNPPVDHVEPPAWAVDDLPAQEGEDGAEASFWALYAGTGEAADRRRALTHSAYAYWTARLVDGAPGPDTRGGALAHPYYATLYARDVDGASREDTRAAAERDAYSAELYAKQVARAVWPGAARALRASGWDDEMLHELEGRLSALAKAAPALAAVADAPKKAKKGAARRSAAPPRFADAPAGPPKRLPGIAAFDADLRGDVDVLAREGRKALGLGEDVGHDEIAAALDAFTREVQSGKKRLAGAAAGRTRAALATLWGNAVSAATGWEWATVFREKGHGAPGLVSPDRAHAHFPFPFVERMTTKGTENTVLLLYRSLATGVLPRAARGALAPVG